jgi:hypothetical protein
VCFFPWVLCEEGRKEWVSLSFSFRLHVFEIVGQFASLFGQKKKERRIGFFFLGEGTEFGCLKARSGSGVFFFGLNQEKKQRKTKKKN